MHHGLTEDKRVYGSFTYAPSKAALRNLKSQGKVSKRYFDQETINVSITVEYFGKINDPFISRFTSLPRQITMYTNAQIQTCCAIYEKDIIYFNATDSIIKRFKN